MLDIFSLQHIIKIGNGRQYDVMSPIFHFIIFPLVVPDWRHCSRMILSVRGK